MYKKKEKKEDREIRWCALNEGLAFLSFAGTQDILKKAATKLKKVS